MKLSISDIRELAFTLTVANTPLSLLRGMRASAGMRKLSKCSAAELSEYYDRVTARAERSEFTMALAYALLIAIVLRGVEEGDRVAVDSGRLLWGAQIRLYLERSVIATDVISCPTPEPKIAIDNSAPSSSGLVGWDGRPAHSWSNR
jgi:hypothetical protein